ncbi:nickel pincer cofactor biosynthesis protein LarC [Halostella sp. JP-L12]|uniref:nickel pincer cofactor biosynthesis protein LarC n=1 Tax=Halostella TaxID=1843185 RepID=UPI000EF84582|nr:MULTISPECIES: nickel pincer cofactor biosynthesis protein LarC [Halostella]NHN47303.1 nickel pincer cofactor biosynthesis protein LarC [Halostella sp. JP-L12]
MRTLAFDGRTGASGDMVLGALVAAGADPAVLAPVEDALGVEYAVDEATKSGIAATNVRVLASGADDSDQATGDHHSHDSDRGDDGSADRGDGGHEHSHSHDHDHDHTHDAAHSHGHTHDDHSHDHAPIAEGRGPLRTYPEVVEIVEGMGLPEDVVADATAVFEVLGEAEAAVHGTDLSETHFHEVGADDAIADVVGAALLLDDLGVDRVVTTPVRTGGGTVEMSHGVYPVPAPAVVEIVERADWAVRGGPVERELLTPTGAAILAHFAEGGAELPALDVTASGYGAGGYDLDDRPNVLRAMVGEEHESGDAASAETADGGRLVRDDVAVLETNVDDVAPEVLGSLQETLSEAGARDVTIVPTTMKKSRPGHLVKVIAKPEDAEAVARRLAEETGTLGVREGGATHRWIAERAFETATLSVDGREYEVAVKVASNDEGEVYDVSAEYDDALAVAGETELPVREVLRRAESAVKE